MAGRQKKNKTPKHHKKKTKQIQKTRPLWLTTHLPLKPHKQNISNSLFAKYLRARLQIFFLLHFYEGENLFHLIQRNLATLTDDIRDV